MNTFFKKLNTKLNLVIRHYLKVKNQTKYFCIGRNKTGTTSLKVAFEQLGFVVGNQYRAEKLMDEYWNNNFQTIIDYCKTARVFQDVPFSYPETYKQMDKAFPNSKFILTIRDSPDQWYDSLLKFHSKKFGKGIKPTWETLKSTDYIYKGWSYKNRINLYKMTEQQDPYDKEILTKHYINYNNEIKHYFKNRPDDLLVLNLSEENAYQKFCNFIGVKSNETHFPWENKTADIQLK